MNRKKKKQLEQEKLDKDFGYDGYYNDIEPEDINEQSTIKEIIRTAPNNKALTLIAVELLSFFSLDCSLISTGSTSL